jgi:hypothetical protein
MSIKNYKEIELKKLIFAAWNYKGEDPELMERLKANIVANGAIENLVVRPIGQGKYEVVNGNHRLQAYKELNMKTALCYDMGDISDAMAKRVAVELNETKFPNDSKKLAAMLNELKEEYGFDELKMTSPLDEEALANTLTSFEENWDQIDADVKEKNGVTEGSEPSPKAKPSPTSGVSLNQNDPTFAKVDFVLTPEIKAALEISLEGLNKSYGIETDPTNLDSTKTFKLVNKLLTKQLTKEA